MALNVDTVYKTVLLIMNKEQRGYVTPDEFNKVATQVQLQIFENYFEDYTQQLRTPQNTSEYSERLKELDNKISIFKTNGPVTYVAPAGSTPGYFVGPTYTSSALPVGQSPQTTVYKLGTVIYKDEVELQRIQRNDFIEINKSPLTRPTTTFPSYLWENNRIIVYPQTINTVSDITISYIRKPLDVIWGYTATSTAYVYNPSASVWPELDSTEQVNFILKVLIYMGVIINDPLIVQVAAQESQKIEVNAKS
tara:strand:- start:3717 stop:4469 length:753 start_codon:yes stop_codon:yes gene_type:complete